jgi:hypothetical protein
MAEVPDSKQYIQVYTAYGQLAGEMIRMLLESVNIPAVIIQESAGTVYGLTVGRLGEVKVMVPAEYVEEAQKLLQDMDDGKLENDLSLDRHFAQRKYMYNKIPRAEIYKE